MNAIALLLIAGILVVSIVWRLCSRRQSLPCPVWLRWMVELDNPFTKTNRADFIIAQMNLLPGMAVLDAGCGPGRLTIKMAKAVGPQGDVLAMDIQEGMLQRVLAKAGEEQLANVRTLHAGLGQGALADSAFDCAVLVTVLGEIPDQESAMREVFRSLKPGGLLSVTEVIFDPHFQTRSTVSALARAAGFQETAFFGHRLAYVMHLRKPG